MDYVNAKGRIYDIQGYAVHDGPGVRTTVYTKGCPLSCLWCHSPESQGFGFELGYLDVKCVGTAECGGKCVKACPRGAVIPAPLSKATGREELIERVNIDRGICNNCLACTDVCIPGALYKSGWDTTVDEVFERLMKDRVFFKNGGGVTISGGEAMSQFNFTYNLAKRLKGEGLHICLDTTGFAPPERFVDILPYIDLFLYDIKCMDSKLHKKMTGVPNELILSNAGLIAENGGALQIRMPIIPKLNTREEFLRQAAEFCVSLGAAVKLVQLLPYHASGRGKYGRLGLEYRLKNVNPPSEEYMQKLLKLFESYGLKCQVH